MRGTTFVPESSSGARLLNAENVWNSRVSPQKLPGLIHESPSRISPDSESLFEGFHHYYFQIFAIKNIVTYIYQEYKSKSFFWMFFVIIVLFRWQILRIMDGKFSVGSFRIIFFFVFSFDRV